MRNPLSFIFRGRSRKRLTPDGLPITEFPAPVQQLLRLYGVGGSYAQIYARQPNVRTVVDDIAREAAMLSLKMYEKDPRGKALPDARFEVGDHPMMHLLGEPSPGESTYRFWFALFADKAIYDRAIWLKIRVGGGPPRALRRIPPANLLPIQDPVTGRVLGWRTSDGSVVRNEDVVVFWGYDPNVNHGSIAPMETLRRLLAEEHAAGMDREGRWRNALRKDGVIEQHVEARGFEGDEQRESFMLDVEDSLSGAASSGRPLLLEPGMAWKDVQWSPKDMEYIQGRKLNRLEVAAAFHYPPAKVAANENGSEPDADTLEYFYTSTLPPYLTSIEREIEAQLLPEFDLVPSLRRSHYVEFNLAAKLRGSFEKQAAIMATTAGGPVVTVNEARARLNLPPIPGGDLIFVPLNSVRGGGPQGSPRAPVESQNDPSDLEPAGITPGGGVQAASALDLLTGDFLALGSKETDITGSEKSVEEVLAKSEASARRNAFARHLMEMRPRYEQRYAVSLEKAFGRMKNVVKGGKDLKRSRWDRELADDIFGVMFPIIEKLGQEAADEVQGTWDPERTVNFLKARTENAARNINAQTEESLQADEPDLDAIFGEGRIDRLAREFTTFSISWSQLEMAKQNGELDDDDRL